MVRLALFDLDDTLVDRAAAFSRWAQWFAGNQGRDGELVAWLVEADDGGMTPRRQLFTEAVTRQGLDGPVQRLVDDYRRTYPTFFAPDPEVTAALGALRAEGWRVGVVTNGPAEQYDKVVHAGLAHLVDHCSISFVVGAHKPDRRIFEHAVAGTTGLTLDELGRPRAGHVAWMVGDRADADVVGALDVGLRTVWMHRSRPWTETAYRPHASAATVAEAVAVLRAGDGAAS